MGEHFNGVVTEVQDHLKQLVKTAGLADTEESLESMAQGWLEKQTSFHEQTKAHNLEEVDMLEHGDPRGALIMTYSGSLLTIGPDTEEGRAVEYSSIGLRNDVPDSVKTEGAVLAADVEKNECAQFEAGPIRSSSPVYAIAVAQEEMDVEAEEELLGQVTLMLAEDFVEINKTLIEEEK
jgi:hypothetical protein